MNKNRKNFATLTFTIAITLTGALMMTVTSGPTMRGAAFLWLPAALQLMAGVWLGPVRGGIAGGVGAYAAGVIAYGGFSLPNIIINFVAGGLANASLPAVLFRLFSINPDLGAEAKDVKSAIIRTSLLLVIVVVLVFNLVIFTDMGFFFIYLPALVLVIAAPMFLLGDLKLNRRDFTLSFVIVVITTVVSASIGVLGAVVAGQPLVTAIFSVGVGWFLGDTVSCIIGLYLLATLTEDARRRGIAD